MGLSEKELKILEKILLEERHRVLKELNYYYNTISKEQREIFGDNINYSTTIIFRQTYASYKL